MSFYKIKTYVKLSVLTLLVVAVLVFMASNFEKISIKFLWWNIWQAPTFALILVSASLGVTFFLISRQIRKVISDIRNIRHEKKTREKLLKEIKQEVVEKGESNSN